MHIAYSTEKLNRPYRPTYFINGSSVPSQVFDGMLFLMANVLIGHLR